MESFNKVNIFNVGEDSTGEEVTYYRDADGTITETPSERILPVVFKDVSIQTKPEDFDFDRDYVDMNRLVNWDTGFMDGGTGQGYIWNVARRKEIKTAGVVAIRFETPKGRENFTTWAYSDVKNGLANKLMWGLNKQTTSSLCYIAIPQVDWENIHETHLWKNTDYDGSVLKEMGLKWSEDRNAVEYI